jgi:hypothetical protein
VKTKITDLAARHGLEIPLELRVWWNWHDGAVPLSGAPTNLRRIGPGGYEFLPLTEALSAYEFNRRVHHGDLDSDGVPTTSRWEPAWLPFMTQGAERLYVDCDRVFFGEFTPVRLVSWGWELPEVDRATSVTHAVTLWLWLLESGFYKWDNAIPGWDYDTAEIPDFVHWTGLV